MSFFTSVPCGMVGWPLRLEEDLTCNSWPCFRANTVSRTPPRVVTADRIAMMLDAQVIFPVSGTSKEMFKVANSREALRILSYHDEKTIKTIPKDVLINLVQATIYEGMGADIFSNVASFLLSTCRKNKGIAILERLGKEGCEKVSLGALSILASSITDVEIDRPSFSCEVAETLIKKLPVKLLDSSKPLRVVLMRDYFEEDNQKVSM